MWKFLVNLDRKIRRWSIRLINSRRSMRLTRTVQMGPGRLYINGDLLGQTTGGRLQ